MGGRVGHAYPEIAALTGPPPDSGGRPGPPETSGGEGPRGPGCRARGAPPNPQSRARGGPEEVGDGGRPGSWGGSPLTRFLTSAESPYEGPLLNCVELMAGGTDGRADWRTDRQTDGREDGGAREPATTPPPLIGARRTWPYKAAPRGFLRPPTSGAPRRPDPPPPHPCAPGPAPRRSEPTGN